MLPAPSRMLSANARRLATDPPHDRAARCGPPSTPRRCPSESPGRTGSRRRSSRCSSRSSSSTAWRRARSSSAGSARRASGRSWRRCWGTGASTTPRRCGVPSRGAPGGRRDEHLRHSRRGVGAGRAAGCRVRALVRDHDRLRDRVRPERPCRRAACSTPSTSAMTTRGPFPMPSPVFLFVAASWTIASALIGTPGHPAGDGDHDGLSHLPRDRPRAGAGVGHAHRGRGAGRGPSGRIGRRARAGDDGPARLLRSSPATA